MSPVRANMYYVYILRNLKSGRFYTGYTSDLRKRLSEHANGTTRSTRGNSYELVYYEACKDMNDAMTREKYLKTGMGKRYVRNRIRRFLALTG